MLSYCCSISSFDKLLFSNLSKNSCRLNDRKFAQREMLDPIRAVALEVATGRLVNMFASLTGFGLLLLHGDCCFRLIDLKFNIVVYWSRFSGGTFDSANWIQMCLFNVDWKRFKITLNSTVAYCECCYLRSIHTNLIGHTSNWSQAHTHLNWLAYSIAVCTHTHTNKYLARAHLHNEWQYGF